MTSAAVRRSMSLAITVMVAAGFLRGGGVSAAVDLPLIDAVRAGDVERTRALIADGVDVDTSDGDGTTALHWAALSDDVETGRALIEAGARFEAANRFDATPLALAAENGSAAFIELLLDAGADPDAATPEGETALMTVARTGRADAMQLLLDRGADPNPAEGWRGQTALMWASAENNLAAAETLLAGGADVHARSTGGFSPLMFAVRAGYLDMTRLLVEAGASAEETLFDGTSALVLAAKNGHYELGAYLLDAGADPDADDQGWTALHEVKWTRRPNLGFNNPPPIVTGSMSDLEFIRKLAAHGADLNARMTKEPQNRYRNVLNRIGSTPFLLAAKAADVEMMRLLVELGADPQLPNEDGTSPLMVAAGVGIWAVGESPGTNEEALEAVVRAGARRRRHHHRRQRRHCPARRHHPRVRAAGPLPSRRGRRHRGDQREGLDPVPHRQGRLLFQHRQTLGRDGDAAARARRRPVQRHRRRQHHLRLVHRRLGRARRALIARKPGRVPRSSCAPPGFTGYASLAIIV